MAFASFYPNLIPYIDGKHSPWLKFALSQSYSRELVDDLFAKGWMLRDGEPYPWCEPKTGCRYTWDEAEQKLKEGSNV